MFAKSNFSFSAKKKARRIKQPFFKQAATAITAMRRSTMSAVTATTGAVL
jgi:hypothetical protein